MKKHLLYAALFVGALSSCSKDNDRVSQPSAEANNDLQEIKLSVSNTDAFSVETRGIGMVGGLSEAANVWNKEDLYILMTQADTVAPVAPDYTYTGLGQYILNNVKVTAPDGKSSGLVTGNTAATSPEVGHFYYYPTKGLFDFYGYYVDDACGTTVALQRGVDSISVQVEIDGSQDLMVAKADFAADDQDNPELANYGYGAYAARRGVQPMLNFKHLLSQLQFEAINKGDATLKVDTIFISSLYKATMNVAGKNHGKIQWSTTNVGDTTKLYVHNDYTGDRKVDSLEAVVLAQDAAQYSKIGNLLLPAGPTVYEGEIWLTQELPATITKDNTLVDTTVVASVKVPFNIKLPAGFAAGFAYTVKIKVYGLSQIGVTANLTQWNNGGSFEVTPEDQVTTGEEAIFTASTIQKGWVVKDKGSYYKLPEAYRQAKGEWNDEAFAAGNYDTPWLVVSVTPHAASTIEFSVKNSLDEERTFSWPWGAEKSFITISQTELNEGQSSEWEMTSGSTWTVVIGEEEITLTI